jgi:DNA-binding NarL/FixJ family response regulator
MTYRILLVDDHAMVREGFKRLLDLPGLSICGEASDGREALEKVDALKPDLVLMDLSMPIMGGIEATREIRRLFPAMKVIIVSLHDSVHAATQAKQAGADGYVVKSRSASELVEAISEVLGEDLSAKKRNGGLQAVSAFRKRK